MKNKVSFDFDSTLSRNDVQGYAQSLIKKGFDVWICTSRLSPENSDKGWNDDLFAISDKIGISRENIIFCNYENKSVSLKDKSFLFHLDDDWIELNFINAETDVVGISCFGNQKWKSKCDKVLETINKQ